jgi:hypothetical protein
MQERVEGIRHQSVQLVPSDVLSILLQFLGSKCLLRVCLLLSQNPLLDSRCVPGGRDAKNELRCLTTILGAALCPSKSGLMNKHIVKHKGV